MTLIGLIGKKYSGKSTVANYLNQKYGFKEYAFADALKKACMDIFDLKHDQLYDPNKKEIIDDYWELSPRKIMQDVGSLFRNLSFYDERYSNIWIRSIERKIDSKKHNKIVISDVRYQDEADMILRKGGVLIKIIRPNNNIDPHESENQNIESNYIIYNESTLDSLFEKIQCVIKRTI